MFVHTDFDLPGYEHEATPYRDGLTCYTCDGPIVELPSPRPSFVDLLNETSVTFVRDVGEFWRDLTGPGFEATTPFGEIRAFASYAEAQAFRLAEVRAAWISK